MRLLRSVFGLFAGSGTDDAWDTVAHELGHALGRDHAPCDVDPSDVDPAWPDDMAHRNAALGVYGYDFERSLLINLRRVAFAERVDRGAFAFTLRNGRRLVSSSTYRKGILEEIRRGQFFGRQAAH